MKIAILTRRAGFNMGSTLQAFAISKFMEKLGYPNVVINYDEYSGHWRWRIKPILNTLVLKVLDAFPYVSKRFFGKRYSRLIQSKIQMNRFFQFEKDYIPLTKRKYTSLNSMEKDFKGFDACICGSDQIWSPYFFDPAFFLSFITSPRTKKVAYAPSLGVTELRMIGEKQRYLMNRIPYISCREIEGAQLISCITGKEIPVVLDPTLMLDFSEWQRIAENSDLGKNEKYILTYFLNTDYDKESIPHAYIEKLKAQTGLPVYNIALFNFGNNIQADRQLASLGPLEFLSYVKNAEWVCTNSFHCCIFSYIFERRFVVFERYMKDSSIGSNQNPRIYNLMKLFCLPDAIVAPDAVPDTEKTYDFAKGRACLDLEREKSIQFIKNALA